MDAAGTIPVGPRAREGEPDAFSRKTAPRSPVRCHAGHSPPAGIGRHRRPGFPGKEISGGHLLRGLIRRGESGPGRAARSEEGRKRVPQREGDQHGVFRSRGDRRGTDGGSADTGRNISGNGGMKGRKTEGRERPLRVPAQTCADTAPVPRKSMRECRPAPSPPPPTCPSSPVPRR